MSDRLLKEDESDGLDCIGLLEAQDKKTASIVRQEMVKEMVDDMTLAAANGNTERERLTNFCDLARKYEAKLKEGKG